MKRILFEIIRTTCFVSAIVMFAIFAGVAINELWLKHFSPLLPEVISFDTLLSVFKISGIATITTMPIFLFGMAVRAYSQRQTAKDGEEVVKMVIVFATIMVVIPSLLLIFQNKIEHLAYFALYWVVVAIVGQLGKYAPSMPAFVHCIENIANRLGFPK